MLSKGEAEMEIPQLEAGLQVQSSLQADRGGRHEN
jgi:hypothetical protein